jgi:hypothetical protein
MWLIPHAFTGWARKGDGRKRKKEERRVCWILSLAGPGRETKPLFRLKIFST